MSPQPMCRQYCGYMLTKYEFDEQSATPGGGKAAPMFTEVHVVPPLDEMRTMFVRFAIPPPPSFIVAMKTWPSVGLTVICTSRTKLFTTVTGADQVAPPSSDQITWTAPPLTRKLL